MDDEDDKPPLSRLLLMMVVTPPVVGLAAKSPRAAVKTAVTMLRMSKYVPVIVKEGWDEALIQMYINEDDDNRLWKRIDKSFHTAHEFISDKSDAVEEILERVPIIKRYLQ